MWQLLILCFKVNIAGSVPSVTKSFVWVVKIIKHRQMMLVTETKFCNHEGLGYICQNVLYKYSNNTKPKQRNAVIVVPSINYQQHTFVDGKSLTWILYLSN